MVWRTKSILIYAGLPIFTICAAALYYVHRKDKEWERYMKYLNQAEKNLKVPISSVGFVIGRSGCKIKAIQESTNTRINFSDDTVDNEFRVCYVKGKLNDVEKAVKLIEEAIESQAALKTLEMWVPAKSCGRIIGRCGDTIRAISKACNASINLDKLSSQVKLDQKLVIIKGNDEQIAHAKRLIEEKIAEDEVARNKMLTSLSNRSPRMKPKKAKEHIVGDDKESRCEKLMASSNDNMIQVYVSTVATPTNFWLQLISHKAGDLDHLVDDMTDYYNNENNRNLHKLSKVSVGQIAAARLPVDGKWYRVEIVNIEGDVEDQGPDTMIDVFFVDYGDSEYQKLENIFQLRPDYLTLRFQAIEATMRGIVPVNGTEWPEESICAFEDLTHTGQWVSLMACVVDYSVKGKEGGQLPCVRLFDPEGQQGIDIAQQLVELGHAKYAKDKEEADQENGKQLVELGHAKYAKDKEEADQENGKQLVELGHAKYAKDKEEADQENGKQLVELGHAKYAKDKEEADQENGEQLVELGHAKYAKDKEEADQENGEQLVELGHAKYAKDKEEADQENGNSTQNENGLNAY